MTDVATHTRAVLDAMARDPRAWWTLDDLAFATDLDRTALRAALGRLIAHGWVTQGQAYRLTAAGRAGLRSDRSGMTLGELRAQVAAGTVALDVLNQALRAAGLPEETGTTASDATST